MAIDRIITYIIVILVGLILTGIYFSPGGQFGKAKGAFDKTKDTFLPDITLGQKPLQGSPPTVPLEHREQLTSLKQAIQHVLYSEKRNCFAQYTPFSELGERGTSLELYYHGDGTDIIVNGGAGGTQEVSRDHLIGVRPCVIAGDSQTVENFDHAFLNREGGVQSSYFTGVNFIRIAFDTSGYNENRIAFGNSPEQLSEYYDFEGRGWLFTPDNIVGDKHICFFPTRDYGNILNRCAASGGLLDDDCFSDDIISIPALIRGENLDQC